MILVVRHFQQDGSVRVVAKLKTLIVLEDWRGRGYLHWVLTPARNKLLDLGRHALMERPA
jgi:hypothetical protein